LFSSTLNPQEVFALDSGLCFERVSPIGPVLIAVVVVVDRAKTRLARFFGHESPGRAVGVAAVNNNPAAFREKTLRLMPDIPIEQSQGPGQMIRRVILLSPRIDEDDLSSWILLLFQGDPIDPLHPGFISFR